MTPLSTQPSRAYAIARPSPTLSSCMAPKLLRDCKGSFLLYHEGPIGSRPSTVDPLCSPSGGFVFVGHSPISQEATRPRTLYETQVVQGHQSSIRSRLL